MRRKFENLKFTIVSILVLMIFGALGYWAFSTIESGTGHINSQEQKEIAQRVKDLTDENYQLKRQLSLLEEKQNLDQLTETEEKNQELDKIIEEPVKNTEPSKPQTSTTSAKTYKYQSLIDELQSLVNKNAYLKLKSQGPAVGSVQKFLNIYNNTNSRVDNDYGPGTVTLVKSFQKANGLTADGEVGVGTLKKMISWLKTK
jgi:murein L,D-transpeptidase YcbB/YkuD